MIIGITGSFGSGKTTVASMLRKYGYKIINADKIGHRLYKRKAIKSKVIKKFGKKILTKNRINRKKLKNIVFYNKKELKKLNKIMWPEIIKEIKSTIKMSKTQSVSEHAQKPLVFDKSNKKIAIDAAILIEAKALSLVDKLIVVKINRKEQTKRLINKAKYTKQEINNIISSQLSQSRKLRYADYIIDNSKSIKHTKKSIKKIIKKIKNN